MKNICVLVQILLILVSVPVLLVAEESKEVIVDTNIAKTTPVIIDFLSACSLYLIQVKGDEPLGTATGFVISKGEQKYLITNWHVVTCRDPLSNQPLSSKGAPDALWIWHHGKTLGTWVRKRESLLDESGKGRWLEHKNGRAVDVVALPLTEVTEDVQIYLFDLSLAEADIVPEVAMPVSIVGFPGGFRSAGFFPIWKTGHIASEPNLDYHNEPLFLIDATTRSGMSGSPVFLRMNSGYKTKSGNRIMSSSGYATLFLGVYSGRLSGDWEIGRVWRPKLIEEILEEGVCPIAPAK